MTEQSPSGPRPDLSALTAAIRSIERGENPAAPAPRGDAAGARRRRREAMAEETARLQAEESATESGPPPGGSGDGISVGGPEGGTSANDGEPGSPDSGTPDGGPEGSTPVATGGAGSPDDGASGTPESSAMGTTDGGTTAVESADGTSADDGEPGSPDSGTPDGGPEGSTPVAMGGAGGPEDGAADAAGGGGGPESGASGSTDSAAAAVGRRVGGPDDGTPRTAGPGALEARANRSGGSGDASSGGPDTGSSAVSDPRPAEHRPGPTRPARPGAQDPADRQPARTSPRPGPVNAEPAAAAPPPDPAAVAAAGAVLRDGGAPGELAAEAVRVLGEGAAASLREDPWGVLALAGVRLEQADAFARALLGPECGPGDERRARALVGHLMEKAATAGHTALTADALRTALARHGVPDPAAAVTAAVEDGLVLVFREGADEPIAADADDADVTLLLGLDRYALAEESFADGCVRLLRSFEGDDRGWAAPAAAAPSPSAAELMRAAAGSGLVLHTGGEAARAEPAALVAAARAAGLRAYAATYTQGGRRRLAAALGEQAADAAVTVEGLLAGREGPGRDADSTLALDLLAVLDAPQLSVVEGADLVEALPDGARLVLSGDPDVLWSTGPGRAFADLLSAGICPRVASRTPDPGPIGELLSCVSAGELAAVDAPGREVVVVPVRDPREAVHRTVQLVADSVPRVIGVPADRTQVITPAHTGPCGTRALNAALKERLNPGPGRFAGFDPGDRVVHVPVFGRALHGTVVGAEPGGLRLECEQGPVLVPRDEVAGTVRHGWAVTAHQAAGTRWPAVVVVVPGDAGPLLTRPWVYTAFGRGARHLSVVQGADQALAAAVAGVPAKPRTTRLTAVLRELAADA